MTKKRHAKLLRAFVTRAHEYGKAKGMPTAKGKDLYRCVEMAMRGQAPAPSLPMTRAEWWEAVNKGDCFNLKNKENREG